MSVAENFYQVFDTNDVVVRRIVPGLAVAGEVIVSYDRTCLMILVNGFFSIASQSPVT